MDGWTYDSVWLSPIIEINGDNDVDTWRISESIPITMVYKSHKPTVYLGLEANAKPMVDGMASVEVHAKYSSDAEISKDDFIGVLELEMEKVAGGIRVKTTNVSGEETELTDYQPVTIISTRDTNIRKEIPVTLIEPPASPGEYNVSLKITASIY